MTTCCDLRAVTMRCNTSFDDRDQQQPGEGENGSRRTASDLSERCCAPSLLSQRAAFVARARARLAVCLSPATVVEETKTAALRESVINTSAHLTSSRSTQQNIQLLVVTVGGISGRCRCDKSSSVKGHRVVGSSAGWIPRRAAGSPPATRRVRAARRSPHSDP